MQYLIVCENYKRISVIIHELRDFFRENEIHYREIHHGTRICFDIMGSHEFIKFCTREEEGYNRLGFRGAVVTEYEVMLHLELERKRKDGKRRTKRTS